MTDEQINRLVAERIYGWEEMPAGDYGGLWRKTDGHFDVLHNVCVGVGAWGVLYDWLRAHEWEVSLIARGSDTVEARVKHRHTRGYFGFVEDPLPGRALALACLRAYGVPDA